MEKTTKTRIRKIAVDALTHSAAASLGFLGHMFVSVKGELGDVDKVESDGKDVIKLRITPAQADELRAKGGSIQYDLGNCIVAVFIEEAPASATDL